MKYKVGSTLLTLSDFLWLRVIKIDEPTQRYKVRCVKTDIEYTEWNLNDEEWIPAKQLEDLNAEIIIDDSYKRYKKLSGLYNKEI